jgi:hypothetical protein
MFEMFSRYSIGTPVNIQFNYASNLSDNSLMYYRDYKIPKCYYQALQMNVVKSGSYVLWSESNISTYGYIYKQNFDPVKPSRNLFLEHDGTCNQRQFKLMIDLKNDTQYVLVVTTYHSFEIGSFSVLISGPGSVSITHFSKYLHCFINIKDKCTEYETSDLNTHQRSFSKTIFLYFSD